MKWAANLAELEWLEHGFYDAAESAGVDGPVLMQQVHSADVMRITAVPSELPRVDGLLTSRAGLRLTVKTADCAPVLLADPVTRQVAAVHAGWRGAFQGVLENAVLAMIAQGAKASDIRAAVGPHLQAANFVVDQSMQSLFPVTEERFFVAWEDGQVHFDFDAYVCHRLRRAGVGSVESTGGDTYFDRLYYSYRRNPKNPGRQYSCIQIKGEENVG